MWGRLILLARGANATGKKFGLILLVSNMGEGLWICSLYDADVGANGPCRCRRKDLLGGIKVEVVVHSIQHRCIVVVPKTSLGTIERKCDTNFLLRTWTTFLTL